MNREEARARAKELVAKMTVEEAASQLRFDAPAIERLGVPEYNWWNEALHGVARAGSATVFPQAIGLAAAFDTELMEKIGKAIAMEGRAKYNEAVRHGDRDIYKGLTFWAPNINIFRDPRWGRGHETYGEDPYLTGRLGTAFIKGIQQKSADGYMMAAACAKHFAVHSGPEALRHEFDAKVSLKDLFETYLPAFEMCVKDAHVEAVMGAYNRTNGSPCCGHKMLMEEVLRGQWGFEGHFVSDCWAVRDFHEHHHVTATPEESVKLALEAGCDVNCGCTYQRVINAYQAGMLSEETIRNAAVRLMTTRYLLGMFDKTDFDDISYECVECNEHLSLSEQAAHEGLVLLKNDGVLPIDTKKVKTIGVIGPNADSRRALMGNYYGTASRYITVLEGIEDEAGDELRVLYSQGCHLFKDQPDGLARPDNRLAEAKTVAEHSDIVILCLGLDETLEGEEGDASNADVSGDKRGLELPACQQRLMETVARVGKPFVVCMMAGSAMDMVYASEHAAAIIQAWYPGARGGSEVARLLFGKAVPAGKLPITLYRNLDDFPEFTNYSMKKRTYRYIESEPMYPFGFGLGYGTAAITDAEAKSAAGEGVSYAEAVKNGLNIHVSVNNPSKWRVEEVIQIYVKVDDSEDEVRNHRLAAFKRIVLNPGERLQTELELSPKAFMTVDAEGRLCCGGTSASVWIGFGQPDERTRELTKAESRKLCIK